MQKIALYFLANIVYNKSNEFDQGLHNRTLLDEGIAVGHEEHYSLEQIARIAKKSVDEVRTIIEQEAKNTLKYSIEITSGMNGEF